MSSLREAIDQAIKDEFYFDHLDCSDECSKKDGELTSIGHATDAILAAIASHIPPRLSIEANDKHWEREAIEGFNEAVDLMREEMK